MSDDLSGRTLGRYQVLERLGRGGMAEVYRAYQPGLDRYVALKAIYPHLADDPALLERFGREARAVAALRHPNIVQVYDFDVQAGTAFMAMEFVAGPTLKRAVLALGRAGRLLPLPVVGQIAGQLADALAYAHEQGLVHRDVKPANVLLRRPAPADAPLDDAAIERLMLQLGPADVVLTDFGVARIINDSVEHTAAGTILGSPAYMSPEQGRGERVDRRSDIYSLGVVLYELLTGQLPFDADTPFAIVLKHTTAPLPPPRQLRPDLPPALERILLKALAKDPADRFQDAAAFGAAVREQTAGAAGGFSAAPPPAPAAPAPSFETRVLDLTRAGPPPLAAQDGIAKPAAPASAVPPAVEAQHRRRGRVGMMMGCGFTLVVAVVVGLIAFAAGGATVFSGLASSGALVVPTQYQADATAFAATIVADGGKPPAIFATPAAQPAAPAAPTAVLPPAVAAAIADAEAACPDLGCPDGSGDRAVQILDAAIAEAPNSPDLLAARALAYLLWDSFTYRDQVLADAEAALALDPNSARATLARGLLLALTGANDSDRAAARTDLDRALALAPADPTALLARARFLERSPAYYDDVSPDRDQLIADASALLALDPADMDALILRGNALVVAGQPEAALADFDAALAADPGSLVARLRRATVYRYEFGDPEAAMADYNAVIDANPDDSGAREARVTLAIELGDLDTAIADADVLVAQSLADPDRHTFRGFIYLARGEPDSAAADFARALELAGPEYLAARYGRGAAVLAAGDAAAALPDLEFAAEQPDELGDVWGFFYDGNAQVFVDIADAHLLLDDPDAAMDALDASVEYDSDWYLPYLLRARLLRAEGDTEAARADLRQSLELAPGDAERAEVDAELRTLDE